MRTVIVNFFILFLLQPSVGKASWCQWTLLRPTKGDFFLKKPPRQTKAKIAEYVSRFGILVPRRFRNLENAENGKGNYIIRSEHPDEYAGAAGILESYRIDEETKQRAVDAIADGNLDLNWDKRGHYFFFSPIIYGRFL